MVSEQFICFFKDVRVLSWWFTQIENVNRCLSLNFYAVPFNHFSITPENWFEFFTLQCDLFLSFSSFGNEKWTTIHFLCFKWSGFFPFFSLPLDHLSSWNMSKSVVSSRMYVWTPEYLCFCFFLFFFHLSYLGGKKTTTKKHPSGYWAPYLAEYKR